VSRGVTRSNVIASLKELASSLGTAASGTEWHLFGSVNQGVQGASDIDLMIFCESDVQADLLRHMIDADSLPLPLHLSLMTFNEATTINAVSIQRGTLILRVAPASAHLGVLSTNA
jgi:predicted nucleotidyltransferase